jgi:hypothetical protein
MLNFNLTSGSLNTKSVRSSFFYIAGLLMLCIISTDSVNAQGNLILLQKRVVFEGSKRIESVEYGNTGEDTAKFVVSLLHMRMKPDGSFEVITEPDSGQFFADNYVRFFPRNIILAPKESQIMKIQLTNTRDMNPGEYRSHLYFRAIPGKPEKDELPAEKQEGLSVILKPVFGITIPLIIRVGEGVTSVQITDLKTEQRDDSTRVLQFCFRRKGIFSTYGDVTALYVSAQGNETEVGRIRGVAVYTPGELRNASLALKNIKGVDYHSGKIKLLYTKPIEEQGAIMATADLELK